MTSTHSRLACTVAATLMVWPGLLRAQTPITPKLDTSATVGWFASDRDVRGDPYFEDDTQHRWVFAGDVGWYWTEHLKSEIGVWATTTGSSFVLVPIVTPTPREYPFASGRHRRRETRVVAQQIYQFGRNAWVHPYVGAGVAVLWETSRVEVYQVPSAYPGTPVPQPGHDETDTRVKPVVSAGLKAYISPRAFFRSDIVLSPWTSSRDVTVRAGIGVDFK